MSTARPLAVLAGIGVAGAVGAALVRRRNRIAPANADAAVPYHHGARIEKAFTIARSPDDLYAYWRDLANLPAIMSHVDRVEPIDATRSRWEAHGPRGTRAHWDAELIDDTPGRRIAWRSIGGSVPNAGSVRFEPAPDGEGTELRVEIAWTPPGGPLGSSLGNLMGGDPGLAVETDLRRFKARMEAGEVAVNGTDVRA